MISIEEITNLNQFENIRDTWINLFSELNSRNIFSTFEWCYIWWKHYGQDKQLKVLLLREKESIVGIVPLMVERSYFNYCPAKIIKFIGDGLSDRNQFLFKGDFEVCISSLLSYIYNFEDWNLVQLNEIGGNINLDYLLGKRKLNQFAIRIKKGCAAPYMELGNEFGSFSKKLGKGFGKSLRNRQRRLMGAGNIDFIRIKDDSNIAEFLHKAATIEKNSWKGKENKGIFISERDVSFHTELAMAIKDKGWFELFFLFINGQPISYRYGFTIKNTYLAYNTAYDPAYSNLSPGNQLRYKHLETLIADGIKEYDHLRGDETYKFDWPVEIRQNKNIVIYKSTFYSKYLFVLEEIIKPSIKKLLRINEN